MDEKKSVKKDKTKDTKESKGSKPATPTATKKKKDPPKDTKEPAKKKPADTPTKPSTPTTKKKEAATTPKLKKEPSAKKLGSKKEVSSPVAKTSKTAAAGKKPTTPTLTTKAPTKKPSDTKAKPSVTTEEDVLSQSESDAEVATETTPSPTPRPQETPTTSSNPIADTVASSNNIASSEDEQSDDDNRSTVSKGSHHSDNDSLDISIQESDLSNGVEDIRTRFSKLLHECQDNMSLLQDLYKDMTEYLKSKGIQVTAPSPAPTSYTTGSGSIAVTDATSDALIAEKRAAMNPALSLSIDSAALAAYASGTGDSAAIISGLSAQEKAALRAKALLRIKAIKERIPEQGDRAITPDPSALRAGTPEFK